jgi:hypothetical protein
MGLRVGKDSPHEDMVVYLLCVIMFHWNNKDIEHSARQKTHVMSAVRLHNWKKNVYLVSCFSVQ